MAGLPARTITMVAYADWRSFLGGRGSGLLVHLMADSSLFGVANHSIWYAGGVTVGLLPSRLAAGLGPPLHGVRSQVFQPDAKIACGLSRCPLHKFFLLGSITIVFVAYNSD